MERCDVVIAGGRLAGACAAAHFAKAGMSVVVLDKSRFPSDQLSTHLLMPAGVEELRRMGALPGLLQHDPVQIKWVQLTAPDGVVLRERWRNAGPTDFGMCMPRPEQDLELVRAARAAGADVRERCEVVDVLWRGGRAGGLRYKDPEGVEREVHAKLVVGADGRRSTVAALVGAFKPYRASRNGRGLVFRYLDDPMVGTQDGATAMQFREGDSFGFVFPSAPKGRALVLFMGAAEEAAHARKDAEGYWASKLQQHPALAARIAGATNHTKLRSTGDTSAFFRASSGPGWALAGDAGHFKDPVIGQGQRDALWMGRAIAEAAAPVLDDPARLDVALRRWEQERDRECLHSYHFGNIETVVEEPSPVLVEVLRRASGSSSADVGDLFGRARTMPQVLSVPRLVRGLGDALRRGSAPPAQLTRDAVRDLTTHLKVRGELRADRFRNTRLLKGSDHPDPSPPKPPRAPAAETAAKAPAKDLVAA